MEQEAAAVILLGGGFQFYNHQLVGSVQGWAIPRWKELADFCRARQELCWKANPIPQAAIVLSTKAFYENKKSLFTPYDSAYISDMHGLLYACLDAQISTEILLTHRILELTDAELDRYGVLIVSDLTTIEAELRDRLLGYAKRGGSLLIVGAHSAAAAAAKAGCAVTEPAGSGLYLCEEGGIAPVVTEWTRFTSLADGWKVIGSAVTNDDSDDGAFPIAAERNFGSGKLALISFSAGGYQSFKTAVVRDFFGRILNRLFTPAVRVSGSKLVEVMLTEKNGAAVVNLMNTAGAHSDGHYHSVDEIPPLTDLTVEIDCPKPTAVTWEPDGIVPEHFWENGVLTVKLPRLAIHGAIRIVK